MVNFVLRTSLGSFVRFDPSPFKHTKLKPAIPCLFHHRDAVVVAGSSCMNINVRLGREALTQVLVSLYLDLYARHHHHCPLIPKVGSEAGSEGEKLFKSLL